MRRILPVLILLLLTRSVFSQQIREFAVDTVVYTSQLHDFMSSTGEESIKLTNRLIAAWQADSISYPEKLKLIEVSNLMLTRRAQPEPDFSSFLTIYLMSLSGEYSSLGLDKWLESFLSSCRRP